MSELKNLGDLQNEDTATLIEVRDLMRKFTEDNRYRLLQTATAIFVSLMEQQWGNSESEKDAFVKAVDAAEGLLAEIERREDAK